MRAHSVDVLVDIGVETPLITELVGVLTMLLRKLPKLGTKMSKELAVTHGLAIDEASELFVLFLIVTAFHGALTSVLHLKLLLNANVELFEHVGILIDDVGKVGGHHLTLTSSFPVVVVNTDYLLEKVLWVVPLGTILYYHKLTTMSTVFLIIFY